MCQIGGIINIQNEDEQTSELIEQVTKVMLAKMADGNPHGSGLVVSYQDHPGFFTLKSANKGDALAQVLELDKTKPFKHILLHTRYATQGAITETNAHPHLGPTGAIVHNGWCPDLYDSIKNGWHHNAKDLQEKLSEFNEDGVFASQCDTEALALIFNEDPKQFSENLIGDEVFAIAHMDNSGNKVTLFTQYNTVNMAYSHALGAVIFATRKDVIDTALEFLGEVWPVAELPQDKVYYFDGTDMTGGDFDFTEASQDNMERFYAKYYSKSNKTESNKSMTVYDADGVVIDEPEDRDDLDTYFKKAGIGNGEDQEWTRTTLEDGSVVWEHFSGEIIHCNAETVEELAEMMDMPEESEMEVVRDDDESPSDFLDRDFEAIQQNIQQQIAEALKQKV